MTVLEKEKQQIKRQSAELRRRQVQLKLKEQKLRDRHLYEMGRSAKKAGIDALEDEEFLGAMLYLRELIDKDSSLLKLFREKAQKHIEQENKGKTAIVLTIGYKDAQSNKAILRKHSLKWNQLRKEWYGYVEDLEGLKVDLKSAEHSIEIIKED